MVNVASYNEPRDALAHDWGRFLTFLEPDLIWLPIPNLGNNTVQFAQAWELEGLILTGGEDIGVHLIRDETETALLDYFCGTGRPVFGVCRGMQLINQRLGGSQSDCSVEKHVATEHPVHFIGDLGSGMPRDCTTNVNSFHRNSIGADELADTLETFAITDDDLVEGMYSPSTPLAGVMWHLERKSSPSDIDLALVRQLFGLSQSAHR